MTKNSNPIENARRTRPARRTLPGFAAGAILVAVLGATTASGSSSSPISTVAGNGTGGFLGDYLLVLRGGDFGSCASRSARAPLAGASRRSSRRGLWGRGRGRFRTRGRSGAATVRGTIWFTQDRCDGTFVRVRRGVVAVRDFTNRRTVRVRAGRSYLARHGKAGRRGG